MTLRTGAMVVCLWVIPLCAVGAPRAQLLYQGGLTELSGRPVEGQLAMVFRLYAESDGGEALWEEIHQVVVENGRYAVQLGSLVPFADELFSRDALYLGVTVATNSEMRPRLPFFGVPWAIEAETATVAQSVADDVTLNRLLIRGVGEVIDAQGRWVGPGGTQGPAGATGAPGASGGTGAAGATGGTGAAGSQGPQGAAGKNSVTAIQRAVSAISQPITSASYVDVSDLVLNVTTATGEALLITLSTPFENSKKATVTFAVVVDGTVVFEMPQETSVNNIQNVHLQYVTDVLAAGAKTITIQAKTSTGTLKVPNSATPVGTAILIVQRLLI